MNPTISTSATPLADKLALGSKLNPVEGKSRLQHCCSGKHLSLMMLQRELTGKVTGYQLPDSPVQKQIISFLSMLSQTPTYRISLGIDGCGVPVFALPMRNIALAYAKLADPSTCRMIYGKRSPITSTVLTRIRKRSTITLHLPTM